MADLTIVCFSFVLHFYTFELLYFCVLYFCVLYFVTHYTARLIYRYARSSHFWQLAYRFHTTFACVIHTVAHIISRRKQTLPLCRRIISIDTLPACEGQIRRL